MKKLLTVLCLLLGLNSFAGNNKIAQETFQDLAKLESLNKEIVEEKVSSLNFIQKLQLSKIALEAVKTKGVMSTQGPSVGMYILAVILPPLAVWLYTGDTNVTLINLLLTIIGWLPGVVHALVFVLGV